MSKQPDQRDTRSNALRSNALRLEDHRTPNTWLWDELVRRFGVAATQELRDAYIARYRQYNRDKWHAGAQPAPVLHRQRVPWEPGHDEEMNDGSA
jgi:hypothetical protein